MEYVCLSAIFRVAERGEVIDSSALVADDIALFLAEGVIEPVPEPTPEPAPAPKAPPAPRAKKRPVGKKAANKKPRTKKQREHGHGRKPAG